MKLSIFNKERNGSGRVTSNVRSVNVNRKNGGFVFSLALSESIGMKKGEYVMFAKDEDSKSDWYMCVTQSDLGYAIFQKSGGKAEIRTRSLYATSKFAAQGILDDVKAKRAASFLVAMKPVEMDGLKWYRIITDRPLRITN